MAIYSFNHDTFGKTTNKPGAAAKNAAYNARENETRLDESQAKKHSQPERSAAANAAYNARDEATYAVRSHVIPSDPDKAEAWFRKQEKGERKNARMSDRFIGALPRELNPEQCIEAVASFCRRITGDKVPWHFALHLELEKRSEKDWNPHAHIILRDRDIETGKRVLYTSAGPKERRQLAEKGIKTWSTSDFRVAWGEEMNQALERAGHEVRVDHRTLKEQGIDRQPQVHEGPKVQAMAGKGLEFESQDLESGSRTIHYSILDEGSRIEHNASIKAGNRQEAGLKMERGGAAEVTGQKSPTPMEVAKFRRDKEERELKAAQLKVRGDLYQQQALDKKSPQSWQQANVDLYKERAKAAYAEARQGTFDQVGAQFKDKWQALSTITDADKFAKATADLKGEQAATLARTSAEAIAKARDEKDRRWKQMMQLHGQARAGLKEAHKSESELISVEQLSERRGHKEKWQAYFTDRATARLQAGLSGNQSMAIQQPKQMQLIKHHAIERDRAKHMPRPATAATHTQVAQSYYTKAKQARDDRQALRSELSAEREVPERYAIRGAHADQREAAQSSRVRSAASQTRRGRSDGSDRDTGDRER